MPRTKRKGTLDLTDDELARLLWIVGNGGQPYGYVPQLEREAKTLKARSDQYGPKNVARPLIDKLLQCAASRIEE